MFVALHVTAGSLAMVAGAVAFYALKGGRVHRRSGMVFAATMLLMAASGALLAVLKAERLNFAMGVLTIYMVTTAVRTVRRRKPGADWLDAAAMVVAAAVGLYEIHLGLLAMASPGGRVDGMPPQPAFIFGSLALLAAVGDARMMLVGGLRGAQRIARHLWRMGFAMFIAVGSFFLGQADVFPKSLRIMPLLALPVLAVLVLLLYWLARVLLRSRRRISSGYIERAPSASTSSP